MQFGIHFRQIFLDVYNFFINLQMKTNFHQNLVEFVQILQYCWHFFLNWLLTSNYSYRKLHKQFTRATPEMWLTYELAISLYDLNFTQLPSSDWQTLQKNTLQNQRSARLHFTSSNNLRCGMNVLPNRLKTLTNRIDASWLTLSKETYKQKCKKEFITTQLTLY